MDNLNLPQRYDAVSFSYNGKDYKGEVRRVNEKPKGHLMIVKIDDNQYRSFYIEQCENLVNISLQTVGAITLAKGNTYE